MRSEKKLLFGILLAGLILRMIRIDSRDIWYDDAFSIFLARQPVDRIISGTAADTMPPLYYFLLHGWMQLGQSIWFLRSLNVLLSLAIVYLVYRWISDLFGSRAGLWAGGIAAVSPLAIYHAQELRMYVLLTFSLLGYAWFFTRIIQHKLLFGKTWWNWPGMILCGICAMYSHNLAVFTLVVPVVWAAALKRWDLFIRMLGALAAIGIGSLPWLIFIPGQVEKIQAAFWTPKPGLVEILQMVIIFFSNLPLPAILLLIAAIGSFQVILFVLVESRRNRWKDNAAWLLVSFAVIPPSLLFIASYFMRPIFVPRAVIFSSLALFGCIARVAGCGQKKGIGTFLGSLTIFLALLGLPYQYAYNEFPRSPYQKTAATLMETTRPAEIVIHDNKLSYFPMSVYAPNLEQVFLADAPGSHNDTLAPASQQAMGIFPEAGIEQAAGDAKYLKFVVYRTTIQEYLQQSKGSHPIIAWLDQQFQLTGHQVFNDLEIFEYIR